LLDSILSMWPLVIFLFASMKTSTLIPSPFQLRMRALRSSMSILHGHWRHPRGQKYSRCCV
jgi:hypothetical protein